MLVLLFVLSTGKLKSISGFSGKEAMFLLVSGRTITLIRAFFYRALKEGPVSYVTIVDKGSIVTTLALYFVLLKEEFSMRIVLSGLFILAGMLILVWK